MNYGELKRLNFAWPRTKKNIFKLHSPISIKIPLKLIFSITHAKVYFSVGEKPKTGPAAKIGPAKFWLGQFFPNFGWAKIWLGHLWLGQILAGPIFSTLWLGQNLAGPIMAGPLFWLGQFFPLFGWAKVWLLAQFWLGQVAGPYFGWAILAGLMAGSSIGPAIIGPAKFFFTLTGPLLAQRKWKKI